MIQTPLTTPADATNFVCSFRPRSEVNQIIFRFSNHHVFLSHVELVRLVTELSQYYTTRYATIAARHRVTIREQPARRMNLWHLQVPCPGEILPLDARRLDGNDLLAVDAVEPPTSRAKRDGRLLDSTEDVKRRLRQQHQLDLWSYYLADRQPKTSSTTLVALHTSAAPADVMFNDTVAPAQVPAATNLVTPENSSTSSSSRAATNLAATGRQAPLPNWTNTVPRNSRVLDVEDATGFGRRKHSDPADRFDFVHRRRVRHCCLRSQLPSPTSPLGSPPTLL
ncbi:hypothetical protein AAVH_10819 [Aphelenchoides avenae]|nr:hypothetical protein AAVH_10819 [Aphelenchus avenae]